MNGSFRLGSEGGKGILGILKDSDGKLGNLGNGGRDIPGRCSVGKLIVGSVGSFGSVNGNFKLGSAGGKGMGNDVGIDSRTTTLNKILVPNLASALITNVATHHPAKLFLAFKN